MDSYVESFLGIGFLFCVACLMVKLGVGKFVLPALVVLILMSVIGTIVGLVYKFVKRNR